jgi:hypothetical protein
MRLTNAFPLMLESIESTHPKHQLGIRYGFLDPTNDAFQELIDIHSPQLNDIDYE